MDILQTYNLLIFIGTAGILIIVSGLILSALVTKHLWEGLMPYSLLLSILLGVLVIASKLGAFESRFIIDDALIAALILLQLILSVLYPICLIKRIENEPGAIFYVH